MQLTATLSGIVLLVSTLSQHPWGNQYIPTSLGKSCEIAPLKAINDRGQVITVGGSMGSSPSVWSPGARLWDEGQWSELPDLGSHHALSALNDAGDIVGEVWENTGVPYQDVTYAALWVDGQLQILESLRDTHAGAVDINNDGDVVGYSYNAHEVSLIFWDDGIPAILRRWPIMGAGWPRAMNEAVEIVGLLDCEWEDWTTAGFWLPDGSQWQILPCGYHHPHAVAEDINRLGQVVGVAEDHDGTERAFLWTRHTDDFRDLPQPVGATSTAADAINDRGDILGIAKLGPGPFEKRPVLWTPDGLIDLNEAMPSSAYQFLLIDVHDLNDHGQIIGDAVNFAAPDLYLFRVLLTPVTSLPAWGSLAECVLGPDVPTEFPCWFIEFDHDRDADLADFAVFQNAFGAIRVP